MQQFVLLYPPTNSNSKRFLLYRSHSLERILVLVELGLLLGTGVLVLLILRHQIIEVGLGLGELHLVHALAGVPVEEGLATEHDSELLGDALPGLLDGGGVANEGGGHLEALGGDVADGGLDVVGDPLDEVGGVLVDDVEHLLVDLLGAHAAAEHDGAGQVAAVAGIGGAHHVLGVEALLGQLGDGEGTVLLGAAGGEGGEADHEEVEAGEGDHVDGQLAQVAVELAGETEAARRTADGGGDEVVQIAVRGGGELEGAEAYVIQGLVVQGEALVGILHQLVDGEGGVVGLDDGIGHLGRGDDGEGRHDAVGILLTDLGDEEGAHPGTGAMEWVSWNPCMQSQDSASLRTTSRTESMSSAPSV